MYHRYISNKWDQHSYLINFVHLSICHQRSKDTVVLFEDLHDLARSVKSPQHPLQPLRYLSFDLAGFDPIQQIHLK